jgi:Flp pilus assembly pilin Flp
MEKFTNLMKAFGRDESGAAMVEYAVILVVVALVGGATLYLMGEAIEQQFSAVKDCISDPANNC